MKKIMILGASILQLPAIKKSIDMGLEVVVVDMNPDAIGFKVPGVYKEVISTIDVDNIIKAARKHQINGIMTLATDMPMRAVAAVAREMNLIAIDELTAIRATNKADMRLALKNAGVPVPKFYKVSNREEYLKAINEFSVPYILKPADSSGSRGIFEIKDIFDAETIHKAYDYCVSFSKNGDIVVEEYMSGPEVSVETLSIDGVCHVIQITDKLTTGAPHFVEMGHSQPTKLNKDVVYEITEVAKAANKAIGIDNGPSHTEIIITEDGPKIVEIGARLGGDNITTHLVPLSTGVDLVECCIKIALGEKIDIEPKWNKGAAIRYFNQHSGVVKEISGIDIASEIAEVMQISVVHDVGEEVTDIRSSGDRMGFVITQAKDSETAIKKCMEALDLIKVTIE